MRCWLITVGEPLPLDGARPRLLRTGRLAIALARAGHEVTWWTSTFDHTAKRHWRTADTEERLPPGITLRLLHGRGYARNVSLARLADHREVARAFARLAPTVPPPDVILCSFPTIELSVEATAYARARGIPVALDLRDLWPDLFADAVPAPLRPLARLALAPLGAMADRALRAADSLVGISEGYLAWGLRRAGHPRGADDVVIPLGIDAPSALAAADAAAAEAELRGKGVDFARPLLCFSGTFGRTYDLEPLLRAARALGESGVAAQVVIAGDGERGAEWRARAAGLPNVVLTGWLEQRELQLLLSRAAVGVAAYAAGAPQGLPNKVFEYLAHGLPIVSSLRGETEALLRGTGAGLTYDAGRPDALGPILVPLVRDAGRRAAMGAAGRAAFEARFDAARLDATMIAHLQRLAARGAPAGAPGGQAAARGSA